VVVVDWANAGAAMVDAKAAARTKRFIKRLLRFPSDEETTRRTNRSRDTLTEQAFRIFAGT
jgi:hypothetical protein